jgi:hypothetical protein
MRKAGSEAHSFDGVTMRPLFVWWVSSVGLTGLEGAALHREGKGWEATMIGTRPADGASLVAETHTVGST